MQLLLPGPGRRDLRKAGTLDVVKTHSNDTGDHATWRRKIRKQYLVSNVLPLMEQTNEFLAETKMKER